MQCTGISAFSSLDEITTLVFPHTIYFPFLRVQLPLPHFMNYDWHRILDIPIHSEKGLTVCSLTLACHALRVCAGACWTFLPWASQWRTCTFPSLALPADLGTELSRHTLSWLLMLCCFYSTVFFFSYVLDYLNLSLSFSVNIRAFSQQVCMSLTSRLEWWWVQSCGRCQVSSTQHIHQSSKAAFS